ncbi:MAG: hypothetical protein EXR62_07540 [Chloroflexi bacterium]|nr:hypothetical protein [Chloroflexota bacterium]
MRAKVTDQGLLIPKRLLEGIDEVEIREEDGLIVILFIQPEDPIYQLGTEPLTIDLVDASVNHD